MAGEAAVVAEQKGYSWRVWILVAIVVYLMYVSLMSAIGGVSTKTTTCENSDTKEITVDSCMCHSGQGTGDDYNEDEDEDDGDLGEAAGIGVECERGNWCWETPYKDRKGCQSRSRGYHVMEADKVRIEKAAKDAAESAAAKIAELRTDIQKEKDAALVLLVAVGLAVEEKDAAELAVTTGKDALKVVEEQAAKAIYLLDSSNNELTESLKTAQDGLAQAEANLAVKQTNVEELQGEILEKDENARKDLRAKDEAIRLLNLERLENDGLDSQITELENAKNGLQETVDQLKTTEKCYAYTGGVTVTKIKDNEFCEGNWKLVRIAGNNMGKSLCENECKADSRCGAFDSYDNGWCRLYSSCSADEVKSNGQLNGSSWRVNRERDKTFCTTASNLPTCKGEVTLYEHGDHNNRGKTSTFSVGAHTDLKEVGARQASALTVPCGCKAVLISDEPGLEPVVFDKGVHNSLGNYDFNDKTTELRVEHSGQEGCAVGGAVNAVNAVVATDG